MSNLHLEIFDEAPRSNDRGIFSPLPPSRERNPSEAPLSRAKGDKKRLEIFHRLKEFSNDGVLAGGTALALQIGHRRSYDFDILMPAPLPKILLARLKKLGKFNIRPTVDTTNELTVFLDEKVKLTFLYFPFPPLHLPIRTDSINLYGLADISSNKAYTIGRRGEWKDYVDLYFLLQKGLNIRKIVEETKSRFGGSFDEKLFWEQLVYWGDLKDFKIDFVGEETKKVKIQEYFTHLVKSILREKI